MKTWMLGGLMFLCGVCVLDAGDEKTSDLDRMQGTWLVVSLTEKGKEVPKAETDILEYVFDKDTMSTKEKDKVVFVCRIKLDPSKSPKTIDITPVMGVDKDKTEPGIYALEKDQLKLVLDDDRKGRPTAFEGKETASFSVLVLKKKDK